MHSLLFPITNSQALIKKPSRKAHCPAGGIITYAKHIFRYTLSVFFALKWIFTPRSTHPLMSSNISQSSIILLSPVCSDFIARFAIASSIAAAGRPAPSIVAVGRRCSGHIGCGIFCGAACFDEISRLQLKRSER